MRSAPNAHDPAHGLLTHGKTMGSFVVVVVVAAFNDTNNKTKVPKNFTYLINRLQRLNINYLSPRLYKLNLKIFRSVSTGHKF